MPLPLTLTITLTLTRCGLRGGLVPCEACAHEAVVREALDLGVSPVEVAAVHLVRGRIRVRVRVGVRALLR